MTDLAKIIMPKWLFLIKMIIFDASEKFPINKKPLKFPSGIEILIAIKALFNKNELI